MSRAGERALAYLSERTQLGMKFGLATTRALLRELDHPERAFPSVLVAGTNGKGSVVAYLDAALRAGGLRVGRYTSPHLVRVHERLVVNGVQISGAALDACVGAVAEAAERLVRRGRIPAHPTHFEVLTVAAFQHFRVSDVELALLEVGLGGRLDATNVSRPRVSVIVSIAKDHEAFLGDTLASVAREKAGVLRRGRTTVLGPMRPEARRAIEHRAREIGAHLLDSRSGVTWRLDRAATQSADAVREMLVRTPRRTYPPLRPLPGPAQGTNLLVALRTLETLAETDLSFDHDAAVRGIQNARWPGRFQWIPGTPPLLLDGAHNPEAARRLADALRRRGQAFVLLFAAMADKNIEHMTRPLFPLAREIVLTAVDVKRCATPAEVAARAGQRADAAHREPDPARALRLAKRLARQGEAVVITGSLYLVGAVLAIVESASSARK